MEEQPFPIVRVRGGPRDRGRQYGDQAAVLIGICVAAYREILQHYTGWSWEQIRTLAGDYLPVIGERTPHLLAELEAIAQGSGIAFQDVLALNLRTELLNSAVLRRSAQECTAFVLRPTASLNSHTLIGQNWDWKPGVARSLMLLVAEPDNGPGFVTLVEAGLLAKIGMNAAGIGLATNALISDHDSMTPLIPYHVLLRCILEAPSYAEAVRTLDRLPSASAANYLIADRQGAFQDIEVLPAQKGGETPSSAASEPPVGDQAGRLFRSGGQSDRYVHTNHYLCGQASFRDLGLELGPDSPIRLDRMQAFLTPDSEEPGLTQIQAGLADHFNYPYSVCAHPDPTVPDVEQYVSLASIIMDLTGASLWLARGNPCQAAYRRYDFGALFSPSLTS